LVGNVQVNNSPTIFTQTGDDNYSGFIDLSAATIFATTAGNDLNLNTAVAGGNASGNVLLGAVGNTVTGEYLQQLNIDISSSGTDGALTLNNNVNLDDDGAGGNSQFVLTGNVNVIVSNSLTLDTEDGTGTDAAGAINFGTSSISADATGFDLVLNSSAGAGNGGAITIGAVNNAGTNYLDTITLRIAISR
jgi:hypothetical protein